ncbi:phosphoadenylylsulfate reductase (thioredoxin) [Pontibacter ummariensis]|uniref:Adenosine 5'-phosphosulfate reductase n=1 Tax=Pontibacter ummariensis TaxID=1610492 RepID=A0A239IPD7_9BACT|nr:phosphoadenylyl-sulfate reductase [Pontibacter ummariensis]PRY09706.1 phosphoadenylylsulfate reductase (thioredoxin) [Pontibacter ummariensis]SNS95530.1 phosphoadenylylsulfate reductase (thioredoxin) [Pontibacter ummariensis]
MSQPSALETKVPALLALLEGKSIEEGLRLLTEQFEGSIAFSSSLGIEDQLITHYIFENNLPVRVFSLDTGRLFNETYTLLHKTNNHYGKKIEVFFPKHEAVEQMVNEKGTMSFYNSIDDRKQCCYIRKVEPLNRALEGVQLWITGIRADQSGARQNLQLLEWDAERQLIKYNPLLHWSLEEVSQTVKALHIPYNPLHDKGFVSIGCAPCTRAIREGEDFRAGRWWWEDNSKKECGLHAR